jgi:plastocyanin
LRSRILLAGAALWAASLAARAATQTVNIGPSTSFTPSVVTVGPGDTVTWNWLAPGHSTTSDATTGPEVWDSGVLSSGSFSHTFTTLGTYRYYCVIHGAPGGIGMSGQVIVAPPPTVTPTPTPTVPTPTATGAPPTATPSPIAPAAIPDLRLAGRVALGLCLAAAAVLLIVLARRR